ncbi:uncharacterized protein A1O9_11408 [Exophiala aquamarina CBS 119918]|uniref:Inheritance of peroxisomes protein 1 n=1 Tax=Exophiala aquamarina CBS 119918 TaxID=1182545 RepID=A0A072PAE8_9EURO|nr:uncharacterized protein A1O9_11408 [Exophiala aquamarina CBS 119918]KEF52565.1 hypothetical protein A1O9_11408 [Exophiala aquamarina CBS 119918]
MAYPPSSYGDRPALQGYRRSFTLPTRALSVHEKAGLETADADTNTLFSHDSARIILFSPPTDSISAKSKEILPDADYPVDAVETLPWRSRTETLAATGAIVIEKVRGSTYFLKSADQKVIHTIMRNSQCWCVDGESKFVLRIGKLRYYRIELPSESEEDKKKVEELKQALPKVLRFERTPCPFKRAFHVDLPEDAITPRRKGTWKRKQLPQPTTPNTDPPPRRTKTARAWSLQGETSATPMRYGRRGSDYGFDTSRGSSPRPLFGGDGYRSGTPSSLASNEDAGEYKHGDGSSEDGGPQVETQSEQADEDHPSAESLGETASTSEDWAHLQTTAGTQSDNASALESASDVDARSLHEPNLAGKRPAATELPLDGADPTSFDFEASPNSHSAPDNSEETDHLQKESDESNHPDPPIEESLPEQHKEILDVEITEYVQNKEDSEPATSHHDDSVPLPVADTQAQNSHTKEAINDPPVDIVETALSFRSDPVELQSDTEAQVENAEASTDSLTQDTTLSRVSSVDSFHTTNSLTEQSLAEHVDAFDSEKTPNVERFDPFSTRTRTHRRELSEMTVTASTVDSYLDHNTELRPPTSDSNENPATPALARSTISDSSWPDVQTPSSPAKNEGLRKRLKTQRSFSPLPPSTTIFSPGSPTHGHHFTAEILQKACNIALVKPIEAVVLLVHILARIAGGATVNDLINGNLFRRPQQHQRRSSFPDQRSPSRDDTDDEDDYGVPLRGRTRSMGSNANPTSARDTDADSMFDLD